MNRPTPNRSPRRPGAPPNADLGADARWEDIRQLLREANNPPDLAPERLDALRKHALQRYAIETPSLWTLLGERLAVWIESLTARTNAARFLHLAAAGGVGALIALVAVRTSLPPAPTPAPTRQYADSVRPASQPPVSGYAGLVPTTPDRAAEPRSDRARDLAEAPAASPRPSAFATHVPAPSGTPGSKIEKSSQPMPAAAEDPWASPASRAEDTARDLAAAARSSASRHPDPVAALTNPLTVPAAAMPPPSSSASSAASTGRILEDSVLEEMEKLRFKLLINGDHQYLTEANELQAKILEAFAARQGDSAESRQVKALRLLRQAEKSTQERRYLEAINAYNQVSLDMPGSLLAFMARFQIANIAYEHLGQYGDALDEYLVCLESYPTHFFSDEKLNLIHQRVELLKQNSENNWEPLRLYVKARDSQPVLAQQNLLQLLETYPESRLAGAAAQSLAALAATDLEGKYLDPNHVIQTIQKALNLNPSSSQAPALQFSIGQILEERLFKPGLAMTYYQGVMGMDPPPELAAEAGNRLRELNLLRFGTPTP